jgi:hypothetical protein
VRTRSLLSTLRILVRGVVHKRMADRAGACHGDCLTTTEPMTPMFFGYRSDRRPALACASHPVLECLRQTKHRVSAMAHLAVVSTNHTCPPLAQAAHDLRNILASIGLRLETLQRLSGPAARSRLPLRPKAPARIEARSPRFGTPARWATVPWPSGHGLVSKGGPEWSHGTRCDRRSRPRGETSTSCLP